MNDLARFEQPQAPALVSEDEMLATLQNSLYPGAAQASVKMVLSYCRAANLDPMTKPVHIVPMSVKERQPNGKIKTVQRDVVMPGIELYRTKAARTDAYGGMDAAKWGPMMTLTLGGEPITRWDDQEQRKVPTGRDREKEQYDVPEWCEVTVYRIVQGVRCAFSSGQVWWQETYATQSGDTSLPNAMWAKRRRGQLEKCAEALALRRAFPEIGAMNTREEMEGRIIGAMEDDDHSVVITQVQQPVSKSAAAAPDSPPPLPADPVEPAEPAQAAAPDAPAAPAQPAEPDAPADPGPLVHAGAMKMITSLLERNGKQAADLCKEFKVPKLEALPMAQANAAMAWARAAA
jgi:phage recombination protein Bet